MAFVDHKENNYKNFEEFKSLVTAKLSPNEHECKGSTPETYLTNKSFFDSLYRWICDHQSELRLENIQNNDEQEKFLENLFEERHKSIIFRDGSHNAIIQYLFTDKLIPFEKDCFVRDRLFRTIISDYKDSELTSREAWGNIKVHIVVSKRNLDQAIEEIMTKKLENYFDTTVEKNKDMMRFINNRLHWRLGAWSLSIIKLDTIYKKLD